MQKTVRINIQARNQLAKRALKKNRHATRTEWREWRQANTANDRKRIDYAREERKNRREDWLLGPLAPNRNVGTDKGLIGTVNAELINSPELPRVVREKPTKDTASIAGNVVATDQVVVVAGPERIKGRIGYVADVNNASQEIVITNVNVADIRIPFHAPQNPADKNTPEPVKFETREMGIPMSDVRLIAVLPSGEQMIARHVYASGPYAQRAEGSNLPRHTRYIAGTAHLNDGKDVILPWPKEDRPRANRHHVSDTRAVTVEDENWIPSVYYPPLAYDFDVDVNRASVSKATTPYTLGMVEDPVTAGTSSGRVCTGSSTRRS